MLSCRRFAARYIGILLIRMLPILQSRSMLEAGFLAFTGIALNIPTARHHKVQIEQLREAIKNGHPALDLIRRLVTQLHPRFLSSLYTNLWMPVWLNDPVRTQFEEREGFTPPSLVVISPLKECNLQCEGCYASAETKASERLDFDTMDRIITELKSYGTSLIVISGGEPTHPSVWPMLTDICRKHSDIAFMMYTNGTLIDDRKVHDLMELGNLSPAISIEGWREETDNRRGAGVYDKVMSAMDRLREAGVLFGFSLTYTTKNFGSATSSEFIDHLISKGCLYGWYFMYVPVGKDPDLDLLVSPSQRNCIRRFTWDMLRNKGLFIADFWNSGPMSLGCLAGGRYLHINNRGDIEPCVFFKFTSHNIRDCRLIDALRSPLFAQIREGQTRQHNPLAPCQFMDHPHDGMRAFRTPGVRASEEGGETMFSPETFSLLERWSEDYAMYADLAWASGDYSWFQHVYQALRWEQPGACPCSDCSEGPDKTNSQNWCEAHQYKAGGKRESAHTYRRS
ncbi:MAG: radical SAM protein [Armatimonadetes bacterium]|nr:radical SAM protein [Armatimonadota bacterium]